MARLVLGIDVGSTSTKVLLADPVAGTVAAQSSAPVALRSPQAGWAEADTGAWWRNVCSLVPAVLAQAGAAAEGPGQSNAVAADVAAVACTGMVPAVVPVDANGTPLRPAILQNDSRASVEIRELASVLADLDFTSVTGSALTQQSVAPTLRWLARHEPSVWADTRYVLGSYDWLAVALGAAPHIERNWALESGLFPLSSLVSGPSGALLEPVLNAAGIDAAIIAPVAMPGSVIGSVSADAASATGLRAGTAIVTGGADHVLSAYAAGLARPGDWLVKLGGAGDILAVTGEVFTDPRLYLDAHPRDGLWLPNGCMATSGSVIRWFQTVTGDVPVDVLEREAAAARPGELICLPYFLGEKSPLHDPDLRGAFLGLHLGHTRGDLYRAILEAIAYGFRQHADILTERGIELRDTARVSNGGSKSTIWKQILADALGVPLEPVLDHPGAALGAALAAAVGTGLLSGWGDAQSLVAIGDPVEPDPALADRYAEAYRIYLDAAGALTGISHRLARRKLT
jgi:xylulokinase